MPRLDMSLPELTKYRPEVAEPADFDAFWQRTLAEARLHPAEPRLTRVDSPLSEVEVYDVTFNGFAGDPVKAWFLLPVDRSGVLPDRLPTVVEYNGYGGGRGFPHERLAWVTSGYAYLFMDTRGQGSVWGSGGDTPDPHGTGPSAPGFMTRGIHSPDDYYYRRVFTDAVRAIDAVRTLDRVDPERVAVCGGSQGGGIALAAAGLTDGLVGVMPEVPFMCHFERAVGMTDNDPYQEIVRYLSVHRDDVEATFATLAYFDGVNFAKRATAPAIFSVGLLDPICPPSTVFAARNHYAGNAEIEVYPFNEHEGGQGYHFVRQAAWLARQLAPQPAG
ncbi:acetylxylan esterase [Cryobacterium adonitolivorans]|uniref:Acetylxylan esterase n=1 Tax=Cryobacterium adonitolivorans TaxID=1259189 RepID=A0A4R8W0T7_9MICO|nr:acetylxylan esterase [Cryobacterium adonitolivorans]TFB95986.1 acetylxylan esterase [Cryobacterium adonitolivorans]